ncbi:MAG: hypothetical protein II743_03955 [Lachnospiraceae bacterium]|nr:hypothetical protein [Lachnospiraceae bacterium]
MNLQNKTSYEPGKYVMQDVGTLYVGTKYTFEDILESEDIPFKFRLLCERYLLPEADREDTLETTLYYLDPKSFVVKILKQLKAKVKVNVLVAKKDKTEYTTKNLTIDELVAISPAEKESQGFVIQELSVSKFALMAF